MAYSWHKVSRKHASSCLRCRFCIWNIQPRGRLLTMWITKQIKEIVFVLVCGCVLSVLVYVCGTSLPADYYAQAYFWFRADHWGRERTYHPPTRHADGDQRLKTETALEYGDCPCPPPTLFSHNGASQNVKLVQTLLYKIR